MKQDADRARAKDMFRQMTLQEKASHIFQYYWLHMLAGIFTLVVVVVFVVTWQESAATRNHLYIGIQVEHHDQLRPEAEALARDAQWPEALNFLSFSSAASQDGLGSMQLSMYLAADELDFIVCDEYTMHLLTSDQTINCSVTALDDTRLGVATDIEEPLFVLALNDTGRAEKVQQFLPILLAPAS